jgi:hypothetical protein
MPSRIHHASRGLREHELAVRVRHETHARPRLAEDKFVKGMWRRCQAYAAGVGDEDGVVYIDITEDNARPQHVVGELPRFEHGVEGTLGVVRDVA